ncbi:hypothetical protein E4U21_001472 [Claviceps maximensis]|nr:hypothetical protein E4U21_001472 [Claviceps maximensis]
MRSAFIAAVGAAHLATAHFANSTGLSFPATAGDFKFHGCVSSSSGFSGFEQVATSDYMNIDICAASCPTKFMGVSGKNCMCGNDITTAALKKLDNAKCSSPCPGNRAQACGASIFLSRRAGVGPGSAVSLYEREDGVSPSSTVSVTSTVTSTVVETITACPPSETSCPVGSVTTKVLVKPTPVCETTEEWVEWHKKKIVCYGSHCGPEVPHDDHTPKHRVVCQEDHCKTEVFDKEEWNKLVVCKGADCKYAECEGSGDECKQKKIVCWDGKCTVEKCFGLECEKKFVCKGDKCKHEVCEGEDCDKKIICDSHGQDCKVAPPPAGPPSPPASCHGEDCKVPHSPPPCHGEDCKFPQPPLPCHGESCKFIQPPAPCDGENCIHPPPFAPTGILPGPMPTGPPPVAAGAGSIAVNIIGAAAGLLFVL